MVHDAVYDVKPMQSALLFPPEKLPALVRYLSATLHIRSEGM